MAAKNENPERVPKKSYRSPEFTVYGPVVGLTQTTAKRGHFDNARHVRRT